MASLPLSATFINASSPPTLYSWSFATPSQTFLIRQRCNRLNVSCKAVNDEPNNNTTSKNEESSGGKFDRRNVLFGLGGLYGVANLNPKPSAFADPIQEIDLFKRGPATLADGTKLNTGPPLPIKDFILPSQPTCLHVRPAAHLVSSEYMAKYSKAIELMKALPKDDPRNFMQQANLHAAYCTGAYEQIGFPDLKVQIHWSWLFFPFHRWYIYFYEKILGKLIDDPTFALPFWNYDSPAGMQIPPIFNDNSSPLFDQYRNAKHLPPAVIDFEYNGSDSRKPEWKKIRHNLAIINREMVGRSKNPRLFHGSPVRAGDNPDEKRGAGTIENGFHMTVHKWTGDPTQPFHEDMGTFYSAARDPIFCSHHANVDRMWTIWKTLSGDKRQDFTDLDWLNSSFLFYNENKELVRVTVGDSLETQRLGYVYQGVDIPWLHNKPVPLVKRSNFAAKHAQTFPNENVVFPVTLNKLVKIVVKRPKKSRSKAEKDNEEEVLLIDGIQYNAEKYVKFDVYINHDDERGNAEPDNTEFVGSFMSLPHRHKREEDAKPSLSLGITELLEDLEAEEDENLLVTLVPITGADDVTIDDIKIEFVA